MEDINEFCELDDDGRLVCEFPEDNQENKPTNIEEPKVDEQEVRLPKGQNPSNDIDVI